MPHFVPLGFGFGFIQVIINAAVAIAFIWLLLKLSRLADAYSDKLKAKPQ